MQLGGTIKDGGKFKSHGMPSPRQHMAELTVYYAIWHEGVNSSIDKVNLLIALQNCV